MNCQKIGYGSPLYSLPDKYLAGSKHFPKGCLRTAWKISKSENAQKIFDILSQKKIVCSLREGYIRFAPHFYNTKQEIDLVVDSDEKIFKIFT